jgi:hypothetical protein
MNAIHTTRLLAGIAVAAVLTPAAYALTDGQAVSRAEVKQQTRAANQAGALLPAGEAIAANKQTIPATSTRTREQRKAETLAANSHGALSDYGPNAYRTYDVTARQALTTSTKTRAEGKAETLQAAKDHKLMAAGEAIEASAH